MRIFKPSTMLNPVPVVMASCGTYEKSNIITLAWVGTICSDPPMVSISIRKERLSHEIISKTQEFVINLVNKKLAHPCDFCGVKSGREFDKFNHLNLTKLKSESVSAPGILESPVRLECKVKNILELGSHDLFISEITAVTVDDLFIDENDKFNMEKAGLICYSHGEYFSVGEKLGFFGYSIAALDVLERRMNK